MSKVSDSLLNGKKVVFVITVLDMGGAQKQALFLANYLRERHDCQVSFVGLAKNTDAFTTLLEDHDIPWKLTAISWMNSWRHYPLFLRFIRDLRAEKPHILLSYCFIANILTGLFWRLTGSTSYFWGQRDEGLVSYLLDFGRLTVLGVPHFIANGDGAKRYLMNKFNVAPAKISVIPNGVDVAEYLGSGTWRKDHAISKDVFIACMLGNLSAHKDHVSLIKAWKIVVDQLRQKGIQVKLVLAGSKAGTTASLVQLIRELNIEETVEFPGYISNTKSLLASVDIGVFSSISEGMPNAVLEKMASGLAIAATDIPAIRCCVGDENLDYLSPVGDHQTLADNIVKLALNRELRERIGESNRDKVKREHSVEKLGETTARLIERFL